MARRKSSRRRSTRRRTTTRPRRRRVVRTTARKRSYRKYAKRAGKSFKPMIDGTLAGVGAALGQKYLGNWGSAIGYAGVGYFRNNNTLKTMGGVALGRQIAGMIPFIGTGNGGNNGSNLFEG